MLQYEHIDRLATLSAAACEHMLIIGQPGTGKSMFAKEFFSRYEGETFSTQLSRWADETILFGPPNLNVLRKEGEIRYNGSGILAAHWAFIDEIFDASDVLLRTLLGILNERTFARGKFSVRVPLRTAIATANYSRVNEMTDAIVDRFALRAEAPVLGAEKRCALWNGYATDQFVENEQHERISLSYLDETRARARGVTLSAETVRVGRLFADKLKFSPRREVKAAWLAKVSAAMRGSAVAEPSDLLDIIPAMSTIENITETAKQIRSDLEKAINIAQNESRQLSEIQEKAIISTEKKKDKLTHLKELTRAIRHLRSLSPVSDTVAQTRDQKVNELQSRHSEILKELEVIV